MNRVATGVTIFLLGRAAEIRFALAVSLIRLDGKTLVVFRTGKLIANDGVWLVEQGIFHTLSVLGQGIAWHVIWGKKAAFAGFLGLRELATGNPAAEA